MSLLEDVQEGLNDEDAFWQWMNGIEVLENEIIAEHRWYDRRRQVLRKGEELVAVEFNDGSTEMQEDTELQGKVYEVEPVEVTVTKYIKKVDY